MIINASFTQIYEDIVDCDIVFSCGYDTLEYNIRYFYNSNFYEFKKSTLSLNCKSINGFINFIPLYKCNFSVMRLNLNFNTNQIATIQSIKNQIKNAI